VTQKAKEILIKTKRRLFGANIGNNVSVFQGNGLDFSEIKEYSVGDDVKKINWKITAKEQKPFINVFNEERELNIVAAFMISGNIFFGSVRQKQEVMSEILTILGYSAVKNGDRFTTVFFSDKEEKFFKPTKNINSIYPILEYSLSVNPLGKYGDYEKFTDYLTKSVKRKSILFILGDFFEKIDLSILAAKYEIYAILVRDPFEEEPKFDTEISLSDPQNLKEETFYPDKTVLKEFKSEIEKRDKKLFEHFLKNKISFAKVYTNEDPFIKLSNLFRK